MWFESSVRWRARLTHRALRATWQHASAWEDGWLRRHLVENSRSLFGLAHRFEQLSSSIDFQRAVPVRSMDHHRRSTAELRRGLLRGLTVRPPSCLAVSEEAEVPLTAGSRHAGAQLWRLWAAGVEDAHPGALAGSLAVVPEAVSGGRSLRTRALPVIAGEFAVPWVPCWRNAVPARVAAVRDATLRGFLAARFALARDVTLLSARTAADLVALGRLIQEHGASLVRAIHDGTLGVFAFEQPRLCARLIRGLHPDPSRARALGRAMERAGGLRPVDAWPRLKALAVRSGGPRAVLWPWYGDRPVVEAGLFVGPERVGLPLGGRGGLCALTSPGLLEFLSRNDGAPLRQHQLRDGETYQVVVTTPGGLYRVATDLWVRVAGQREGAVLVEPGEEPAPARRCAPPHLAS
ncbi:MAG TPA: GH3 auxin-responsive promoter family protein [Myxococcales bacterium]|nr:GH3 auxin-responsive promoter family protein [Myxococcales bacterium]